MQSVLEVHGNKLSQLSLISWRAKMLTQKTLFILVIESRLVEN